MRLILLLILALAVSVVLIAFPNIADQQLRIEAFGWIFETRQGAFIVALFVLLFLLWLLRSIVSALFSSPGVAWRSMRMGSRRRREKRLREGLAQWLDHRGDFGAKALKKSKGVLPDWVMDMLKILGIPAKDQQMQGEQDDSLLTALAARIATDPDAHPMADIAMRKAHLEAWLHVHPGAPLAFSRMADLAEEEADWPKLVEMLEGEWKQGHRSAHSVKPRLAHAYLRLAESEPDRAMTNLRKAYRLMPDNADVLLAYGFGLVAVDENSTSSRIWSEFLEKHDEIAIAKALLELLSDDALRAYRRLENRSDADLNGSQRWLRAELAHAAKLDGLAFEQMSALAKEKPGVAVWSSLGNWYAEAGDHNQAAACYKNALDYGLK